MTVSLKVSCGGRGRWPFVTGHSSLYHRSQSWVLITRSKSDPFPVRVGPRQGCPFSPALFIIFMDRITRRSQVAEGVKFSGLRILSLLFSEDIVLLA